MTGNQAFRWGGDAAATNLLGVAQDGSSNILYGETHGNVSTAGFMLTLQNNTQLLGFTDPDAAPPQTWLLL